jgi:hypothetical protein
MSKEIMVTTVDNPYNPFEQFDEWLVYDKVKGYNTTERLAVVAPLSERLSDEEIYFAIEKGIETLMRYGAIDKEGKPVEYKKVFKE